MVITVEWPEVIKRADYPSITATIAGLALIIIIAVVLGVGA